jgi:tetratricopeptide (TPR) repeat protein
VLAKILLLLLLLTCASFIAASVPPLDDIRSLRLAGKLVEAQVLCEQALAGSQSSQNSVALHLELARIHDRFGLHNNTRPVVQALRHIEAAAAAVDAGDDLSKANIELAFADYFYRAEMPDRAFTAATSHAQEAVAMFMALNDWHGRADAVHRLGLIRMQQGRYPEARELFNESLALDIKGGARTFFRGEYERHIGFVDRFTGDMEGAILHFEHSLQARREAGAIDASLFAAVSLGSTLVEAGRAEQAAEPLQYALDIAHGIGSRYGEAITLLALGHFHTRSGQTEQARGALERAVEVAQSIGRSSIERRALEALVSLQENH